VSDGDGRAVQCIEHSAGAPDFLSPRTDVYINVKFVQITYVKPVLDTLRPRLTSEWHPCQTHANSTIHRGRISDTYLDTPEGSRKGLYASGMLRYPFVPIGSSCVILERLMPIPEHDLFIDIDHRSAHNVGNDVA
jgi:hypothetical protein